MKKRFLSILCVGALLLVGACMPARAALPGTTCSTAIPLGKDYSNTITGSFPKDVWYTAWTFDLPLSVYFVPDGGQSAPKPEVALDFSCTSGFYTDSIICSLFCANSGSGIQFDMPHKPNLNSKILDDGRFCYYIAIGKEYRDLLLKTGIDYNVEVFVKVTYKSSGTISIAPDDMFTNCMDGKKFMHLGDTVQVKPLDKDRHVVVPYVQWQEDSIRYIWSTTGTNPVEVAVGNECDYDPTDGTNEHRLDYFVLQPNDTLKMTSGDVKYYIHSGEVTSEAGMFFAKFYSSGTGTIKIERVPQAPPEGGATLLRYDRITPIPADTNALYAISYTWDTATIFTTPTDHIFKMYVGTTHDFKLPNAIAKYQFHSNNDGHWLGLTKEQMRALWTHTSAQYLYIRFECTAKTTLKPAIWEIPSCLNKEEILRPSSTLSVEKGSYGAVYYRFYYREWKGGDMKFQWQTNASTCPAFIGKNCTFPTNAGNANVLTNKTLAKNGSWTVTTAEIDEWEDAVDEDGYLYVRFNPGSAGTMKITTTAPEEQDPAPIEYPKTTISVICDINPIASGQRLFVFVSTSQSLSLYAGDSDNLASRTPIEMWSQTPEEDHTLELQPGIYTLRGNEEEVRIVVQ